jgi:small subunit ribosomal protein S20
VPNIKSVKKDVLRSRERNLRNTAVKSRIKTFVKKAHTAIAANDGSDLSAIISQTVSVIDKAAKRNIIHPNAAARRKSRLQKRVNALAA